MDLVKKTYELEFPIDVKGEELVSVEAHEPTLKDYKKTDRGNGDIDKSFILIASITGLSMSDVEEMDMSDILGIQGLFDSVAEDGNKPVFAEDNRSAYLELKDPITIENETVKVLNFSRFKGKDFKAVDKVKGDVSKGLLLIARSVKEFRMLDALAERLSIRDFLSCQEVVRNFT